MKQETNTLAAGLLAAATLAITANCAQAQMYTEAGDAGQTLPTAASTATGVAGTPLTTILGAFGSATDADLYAIQITTPSSFSATTNNAATNAGGQDTALFLFNSSGAAIATNDDASGSTLNSTLPAGGLLYANLAAGTYYLGISESGNEAVNTAGQLLFAGYPSGDTTAVRGAAGLVNPTTESTYNSNNSNGAAGAYEIDLTSAATATNPAATAPAPEPSTWATIALGGAAAVATFVRRRRTL